MNANLFFDDFEKALWFLKTIKTGKIQRSQDGEGYFWDPESSNLSKEQLDTINKYTGASSVWLDLETGLSWLLKGHVDSSEIHTINKVSYGGYNDWKEPTLRELKTLASNSKNQFGVFVKQGLEGRIEGNYSSSTYDRDPVWWNFNANTSAQEDYREGKIQWGSEGGFAGFEKDRSLNSATRVLVRGSDTQIFSDWALSLIEWAEAQRLHEFPSTQENINNLECLDIVGIKDRLPVEILKLPSLRIIKCTGYKTIDPLVFSIATLEDLRISSPYHTIERMDEIPASIENLKNLKSLSASSAGIQKIHESIGRLGNLQRINLSYNKIEVIPDSIKNLEKLEYCDLARNKIKSIPGSIGGLVELKSLKLTGNLIESIPDSIGCLKNLEVLWINDNCFDEIPGSIVDLEKIYELLVGSTKIKQLPNNFGRLASLKKLVCGNTALNRLPDDFVELKNLRHLEIDNGNFDVFPEVLLNMPWLETLKIGNSKIFSIPPEIGAMKGLTSLDISGTQVSELPESLKLLENLSFINVSATLLVSIPEWLDSLKSLRRIGGKGISFPKSLAKKRAYVP